MLHFSGAKSGIIPNFAPRIFNVTCNLDYDKKKN